MTFVNDFNESYKVISDFVYTMNSKLGFEECQKITLKADTIVHSDNPEDETHLFYLLFQELEKKDHCFMSISVNRHWTSISTDREGYKRFENLSKLGLYLESLQESENFKKELKVHSIRLIHES